MRLTWRDGATTVLVGLAVVVALAVTQAWGWPLLGSARAGILVLAVVGLATCLTGASTSGTPSFRDPFVAVSAELGVVAVGLVVAGLIVGTAVWVVALAADLVALWIVTTVRHVVEPATGGPAGTRLAPR